jgi:hypothetical protein
VLFDGPGADVQVTGDLFVAASLNEQTQHLLVTRSDFDFIEVDHWLFVGSFSSVVGSRPATKRSKRFAKCSLRSNGF